MFGVDYGVFFKLFLGDFREEDVLLDEFVVSFLVIWIFKFLSGLFVFIVFKFLKSVGLRESFGGLKGFLLWGSSSVLFWLLSKGLLILGGVESIGNSFGKFSVEIRNEFVLLGFEGYGFRK